MNLSDYDRAVVSGDFGEGARMAMSIILRLEHVYQVDELMDITAAHIDSTVYMGQATLEFAERLAGLGSRVVVPSTLNVSGVDVQGWHEWHVPKEHAEKAYRQMVAYESMGCIPTWTCAPYQTSFRPEFGQQIAAGESNAIAFFNSVIGARTERYPDLLDICCAITGRVPRRGLHLDENRLGELLISLSDAIPESIRCHETFHPVLGHLVGKVAGNRIPVIDGVSPQPTEDHLKSMCAAAATSGAVAMMHIVGVTPEAGTLQDAFGGRTDYEVVNVTRRDLVSAYRELISVERDESIDMVVLGSPHFSVAEFRRLYARVESATQESQIPIVVTCSRAVREIIKRAGMLAAIESFGVRITVDTCPLTTPMFASGAKRIMTNSAKYALYSPGLLNAAVAFGSLDDCVESAVTGKYVTTEDVWD